MIGISKLYCGTIEPSDVLRYGSRSKALPSHLLQFSADKKPVVVWNCTRRCNLRCVHCYSRSADREYSGEMSTEQRDESRRMAQQLFQLIFSKVVTQCLGVVAELRIADLLQDGPRPIWIGENHPHD